MKSYYDASSLHKDEFTKLAKESGYQLKTNLYKLAFLDKNLTSGGYYADIYFASRRRDKFSKLNDPALYFILVCHYIDLLVASIPDGEKKLEEFV